MRTVHNKLSQPILKGEMTMMDTQIKYTDDMMRRRRDAVLSLKEFGFGRNLYEFCADWVLNHDNTQGIKEAFEAYETQRPNQTNQNCT